MPNQGKSTPALWPCPHSPMMSMASTRSYSLPNKQVMLMANLWQEVGLCNGAAGTVSHLLYHEGHAPPNLPIAVLVNFDNICWASPLPRSPQMCTHTTTLSRKEFWRKAPLTTAITSSNQICNHYPQKPGTNLRQSCD